MNKTVKSKRKIKIAFFIDFIVSQDGLMGGTESQLIELINNIKKFNFEPILFSLRSYSKEYILKKIGCKVVFIDLYSFKSLDLFKKIVFTSLCLRREKVDIVQTFFFDSSVFGILCSKLCGIKKIVTSRRDMGFWYSPKILLGFKIINIFTDKVIVNSEAVKISTLEKEDIKESKICVIPNGINFGQISCIKPYSIVGEFPEIERTDRIVGIVANFNRSVKRVDLLVKSAKKVCDKVSNVKFLIIGGGRLELELKALAEQLSIKDKIIFAGPRLDPIKYIMNFNIGVLTSDSEGFSNTLLEYMAVGVPAVVTAVGGNIELIEHGKTGFLFKAGDEDKLSEALILLLNDEKLCIDVGENGKTVVKERYDWDVVTERMASFYGKLIKSS